MRREWRCPDCGCTYTANIGHCGNLEGCSRPKVVELFPQDGGIASVTLETTYEDALRLWVLVHDPANAGQHIVTDAIAVVEAEYTSSPTEECGPPDA